MLHHAVDFVECNLAVDTTSHQCLHKRPWVITEIAKDLCNVILVFVLDLFTKGVSELKRPGAFRCGS